MAKKKKTPTPAELFKAETEANRERLRKAGWVLARYYYGEWRWLSPDKKTVLSEDAALAWLDREIPY